MASFQIGQRQGFVGFRSMRNEQSEIRLKALVQAHKAAESVL